MRFVIVTGMSGAGKTTSFKMLEDMGFFCVDNLPVPLLGRFAGFVKDSISDDFSKVAVGIDVRSRAAFSQIEKALDELRTTHINYEILFMDAADEVLLKRFKESRRNHPLVGNGRILPGIRKEREMLSYLKAHSDYVLDTSRLLTRELKLELEKIFMLDKAFKSLMVTITSFGFKYGIPEDADLVFDVRFLPNPYYVDQLRQKTGNDPEVNDFVMKFEQAEEFLAKLEEMLRFLIPNYISEGKHQLVVAIGCTGGKHRSVTLANQIYNRLSDASDFGIRLEHRDMDKDEKRKSGTTKQKEG